MTRFFAVLLMCLVTFTLLGGCRPSAQQTPQTPAAGETAAKSWIRFVSDAMGRCEANCCVDYQAFEEYEGRYFGVTVVGYRDSEYLIDLFGYDPGKDSWVESPRTEPADGYPAIDVPASSEQWDVPEDVLNGWIERAESAVRRKYSAQ